jgi:hypothetical protein
MISLEICSDNVDLTCFASFKRQYLCLMLGSTVTLDGSASYSLTNDPIKFAWRRTAGPPVLLHPSAANAPKVTFTAPSVSAVTKLLFQVTVIDSKSLLSDTVSASVLVT